LRSFKIVLMVGLFLTAGLSAKAGEKVTGIGGFFFKAKDPKALAQWYETNLGVKLTPQSYTEPPWEQEKGSTVFEPFPESTTYFGNKHWMLNFRVRDLDAMANQLKGSNIKVTVDSTVYPNGRFGQLEDPEGNPIQLWEPR
jgi:glyoxylase I family protein